VFSHEEDETRVLDALLMLAEQKVDPNSVETIDIDTNEEQLANWTGLSADACQKILERNEKQRRFKLMKDKIIIRNINEIQRLVYAKRKHQ
jgi:hypothetical protein